jgi:hypothetical protein
MADRRSRDARIKHAPDLFGQRRPLALGGLPTPRNRQHVSPFDRRPMRPGGGVFRWQRNHGSVQKRRAPAWRWRRPVPEGPIRDRRRPISIARIRRFVCCKRRVKTGRRDQRGLIVTPGMPPLAPCVRRKIF